MFKTTMLAIALSLTLPAALGAQDIPMRRQDPAVPSMKPISMMKKEPAGANSKPKSKRKYAKHGKVTRKYRRAK